MFGKKPRPSDAKAPQGVITETAPCQKSIRLQVTREALMPVRAAVVGEFQKRATLSGFRKGKAPPELVARHYAKEIQEETLHRATKEALEGVVKAHDLKPVGPFELRKAEMNETEGLTLEAIVEVEPSFSLATYTGIPLTRPSTDVTPHDVDQALERLRASMANLAPGKDGEKKVPQLPALDDHLAKDLGHETLEKLKAHVDAKLRDQKKAAQTQAMEAALHEELLKRHTFEVPPRLVTNQTERQTRDFKTRLLLAGMPEEKVNEEMGKFTEQLRTSAAQQVKLTFILDRIATKESLAVTQDELIQRLWKLAQQWKKDPAEVRKTFDDQGLWPSVASAIRQEKTMAFLLSSASVKNGAQVEGQHG